MFHAVIVESSGRYTSLISSEKGDPEPGLLDSERRLEQPLRSNDGLDSPETEVNTVFSEKRLEWDPCSLATKTSKAGWKESSGSDRAPLRRERRAGSTLRNRFAEDGLKGSSPRNKVISCTSGMKQTPSHVENNKCVIPAEGTLGTGGLQPVL